MKWNVILFTVLSFAAAIHAHADSVQLGNPVYGGTGCPSGSASVTLSADQSSLSILFDQYVVQAGGSVAFDRKNCNVAVPVHIPQGYSVSVFAIDYRGFTGLPYGGRAQLNVEYFLAGAGQGIRKSKTFLGPIAS